MSTSTFLPCLKTIAVDSVTTVPQTVILRLSTVAVEPDSKQGLRALLPQFQRTPALHNTKKERPFGVRLPFLLFELPHKLIFAASRPGNRSFDRKFLLGETVVHMGTIVQTDHDVRAISELQLHTFFRRELKFPVRAFRLKANIPVADFAELRVLPYQ